ncbi:hypothetical protein RRG08_023632 [Elysia crispata]|uniref:Uncharacterized protein n=1 Tax=Elysia crispata TaxID=231223 RepID=A0AAE0XTA2_9GAST|nr:hypothetical protein RRG08_023632 [Elysia crispata]
MTRSRNRSENMSGINISEKEAKLRKLEDELSTVDKALANLLKEKAAVQQKTSLKLDEKLSASTLKHYRYILPLVKEVYLLELKVKQEKKHYDEKKWKCEAERLGHELLGATLNEENCVLKKWSNELSQNTGSDDGSMITNLNYKVQLCDDCLKEFLIFTVLSHGVHVGLKIHTETPCKTLLFLRPSKTRFGFSSDTFVPGLEQKVKLSISQGDSIADVVSLVSSFIQEEMAPYVISVSPKKKGKSKKEKTKPVIAAANDPLVLDSSKS